MAASVMTKEKGGWGARPTSVCAKGQMSPWWCKLNSLVRSSPGRCEWTAMALMLLKRQRGPERLGPASESSSLSLSSQLLDTLAAQGLLRAQPFQSVKIATYQHLPCRARVRVSVNGVNTISQSNRNPHLPSFYKFSSSLYSQDRGAKAGRVFFLLPYLETFK